MKNYKKIASGILALSILSSGYSRCPELFADIAFADNTSTVNASVTESNKINSSKSSANTTSASVSAEDFIVSGTYEETTVTTVPYASYDASLSYQTSETTDSYTPSSGINLDEKTGILTISEDMNYNTDMENFITANSDKIKSVVIEDGI